MKYRFTLTLSCLILFSACSVTRYHSSITAGELRNCEKYLTSPALSGRATGTEGDSLTRIYIREELKKAGLKPFLGNGFQHFSVNVPFIPANSDTVSHKRVTSANVAMVLGGSDPELKSEYVIIGAHLDHLGMGGRASSSRNRDTIALHPGADDNASGIAIMIQLAQKLASEKKGFARSIVFVAFSGEEVGLGGSKFFEDSMHDARSKVNLMVNMDMVGRMKEGNFLQVGGVGTAAGLRDTIANLNDTTKLHLTLTDEGSGPSDHFSFYADSIPVIFITTGTHSDYHLPSDTYDKINYDGMVATGDFLYKVIARAANDRDRLEFRLSGPQTLQSMGKRGGVTLGIMPDVAGVVKNGLRADLVTPGKPAALGGMKKGDIIIAIENKPVKDIYEYMERLNELKPGQRITVEVLRNGAREILIIQL
jgi:aminopeptidase YwaD